MNTIAWLFILSGVLVARQVSKGRVMNIGEDLSDAMLALIQGDSDALGAVLTRRGESAQPTTADLAIYNLIEGVTGGLTTAQQSIGKGVGDAVEQLQGAGTNLATVAVILGSRAKGYRWAATGPDYYDCSGLMWRACQAVGYKGSRFSTATVGSLSAFQRIASPATQGPGITRAGVGDIVVWRTATQGHMGVITGPDRFYSARSVKNGIGEASISGWSGTPFYLRYVGPRKSTNPFG